MIAHISIAVRDIDRSKRFYDAVLEPLGSKRLRAARSLLGYGYGGATASGSGLSGPSVRYQPTKNRHICLAAPDSAAVDPFHAAALRSGWHDNGPPGLRPIYGPDYYAALIIDPISDRNDQSREAEILES
jgi:catechol 2,3-dioxygenase-like lactoylglutathione lyase family enzyme